MKKFCEDEHVRNTFIRTASSVHGHYFFFQVPIIINFIQHIAVEPSSPATHPLVISPLELPTIEPADLTTDTLYKLTNRVLNPWRKYGVRHENHCKHVYAGRKGGFYRDIRNKPSWFPLEMEFKCPSHQEGVFE